MSTLGMRIKMARAKESQSSYAGRLDISKGALGFYERDENLPKVDVALRICALSQVNIDWLLTGNGPMRPGAKIRSLREEGTQPAGCGLCGRLETELEAERQERRELNAENRKLWQEISTLRVDNVVLRKQLTVSFDL